MSREMSRRQVAQGLAWSVPVVVLAAQAPALAASTIPAPKVTRITGCTSKTGVNNYILTMTFDGPLTGFTFAVTSVYFDQNTPPANQVPVVAGPTQPAPNQEQFTVQSSNNAGNIYIQVNYTLNGQAYTFTTTAKTSVSTSCP